MTATAEQLRLSAQCAHVLMDAASMLQHDDQEGATRLALSRLDDLGAVRVDEDGHVEIRALCAAAVFLVELAVSEAADKSGIDPDVYRFLIRSHIDEAFLGMS